MTAKTLVITGTDTGVGKTYVSCAILRALASQGLRVAGFKPVASGAVPAAQGWVNEDGLALQVASSIPLRYAEVNPYCLREPIAPHIAAQREGLRIDSARLSEAHEHLANQVDVVVVEGAGGWLVPFTETLSFADWVAGHRWPVLLVVGMRLGCINHALLSAQAIRQQTRLLGWVANPLPPAAMAMSDNIQTLDDRIAEPRISHPDAESPAEFRRKLHTLLAN